MGSVYFTGLSGLNGYSSAIDTVANNLANLQTTGYKANEVEFSDLLAQSMRFDEPSTGIGVGKPASVMQFMQGGIQNSQSPLACSISGAGYFVTTNGREPLYTRDGNFQLGLDASGAPVLTTASGNIVEGYSLGADGRPDLTKLGEIVLPDSRPATATSAVQFSGNLDAGTAAGGQALFPVTIYDSAGNANTLQLSFAKGAAPGEWTLKTIVNGIQSGAGTAIQFDSSGNAVNVPATIPIGVSGQTLNLSMPTITQVAAPSSVMQIAQNGETGASVTGYTMGNNGVVYAQTTDLADVPIGEVALANIANPQSMIDTGGGNFAVTQNTMGYATLSSNTPSAGPYFGDAQTFGSEVTAHSLEQSTSDAATQFTDLITYQRGYEMTAKAITTGDQMRQDLLNLVQ
ncbi:MAG TPA: flagellar hook-basal body complex protein [Bryobacteraceae bacterium]|nr:flagellar hook-basal body complex protein [Bryobacteraceae bacterium]